jgi:hypothetical protein
MEIMNEESREDPLAPFPTIPQRDGGASPERRVFEGVPMHLRRPIIDWIEAIPDGETLARRTFSRLRVSLRDPRLGCREDLAGIIEQKSGLTRPKCDPLDVLNAMLALHP